VPTTKSTLFVVNKDEYDTKEGHEECIAYTAVWQKAPLGLKRCQTAKKIKPVALAIVELHKSEGIRQAGRQAVSRKFC